MVGVKGKTGVYVRKQSHKDNISKSLIKIYSNSENKDVLLKNLNKATKSRNKESWIRMAETRRKNISLGLAKTNKGIKFTEDHKNKISDSNKISLKKFWDGNDNAKIEQSKRTKSFFFGNTQAKINQSKKMKELWKNEDFAKRVISNWRKSLQQRPTSFEQKISNLCFKYNFQFVYTGDGRFLINLKNPDFVNEQEKIVIEVFYSWFKIRDYGSVENYKEFCRKKYEPAGWKVIFIDENEVNVDNWEQICLNKLRKFYEVEIK